MILPNVIGLPEIRRVVVIESTFGYLWPLQTRNTRVGKKAANLGVSRQRRGATRSLETAVHWNDGG